jgi:hypothetical protein
MSIKLVSTGGGSVTIQEPNTASDFTLSVPASSATLLTNKTAGTILQVVQAFKQDTFSVSTNTWTNITGLNVNITPSSTSSRILILSNIFAHGSGNAFLRMTRNGTVIGAGTPEGNREGVTAGDLYNPEDNKNQIFSMMFVDSPSSTSSVSYWAQTRAEQASGYITYVNRQTTNENIVNRPRYASMLIALEIAG